MPPKKRKLSCLSGFELRQAYNSLIKLKQTAVYEASEEKDPDEEGFEEQIDTLISLLESKLEGPKAVCEMYACGKYLQKKVVRGALTNGREWTKEMELVDANRPAVARPAFDGDVHLIRLD
ncbi:hypothetical protein BDR04DRAFT_1117313 [Suillus decipiens]|nr:hypothetical protein BDR04DRAFT_1117313 [Suillus decipiens]